MHYELASCHESTCFAGSVIANSCVVHAALLFSVSSLAMYGVARSTGYEQ